ncbi:MAG: hypothetical protein P8M73_01410 [Luminiphilus sp.]|nr:hypothetical protein [Luminiphilus sp.]
MIVSDAQPLSFERLLRPLWWAVGAGFLVVLGVSLWTPNVVPVMPGSAALAPEQTREAPVSAIASAAFVARPLFLPDRRPSSSEGDVARESVAVVTPDVSSARIDGVTLLGVFASAGVSGVIVAEKGAGKRRLSEGDTLQGWVLAEVEPRSAVFSDGNRTARLDMALLSDLPALASVRDRTHAPVGDSNVDGQAPEGKPDFVPTFDAMYQSRARSGQPTPEGVESASDSAEEDGKDNGQ